MPRSIRVNRTSRRNVSGFVSEKNDRTKSVHTSDGAFGFQVEARGAVKVGGSTWRYLRGAHFIIASNRIELGKNGPPYDGPSNRAVVESYVVTPLTDVAFSADGKKIKGIENVLFRQFDEDTRSVMPFSFGDSTPYDGRMLIMLHGFLRDEESVVVLRGGEPEKEWIRFDTPNTRMAIMRLSGVDPVIVVGEPVEIGRDEIGVRPAIDADRLASDRSYAVSFVANFARSAISAVSADKKAYDLCRSGSVSDLILYLAKVVDESGKTGLGMVLREAAHASEAHCISWSEIDAVGAMQCN